MSSYLELYSAGNSRAHDSSRYGDLTDRNEDPTRRALESGTTGSLQKGHRKDAALQTRFRYQRLDSSAAQHVVSSLSDLIDAIDLSHNHITSFPSLKSSPTGLLALDISFNLLQRPIVRVMVGTGSSPSLSPMSSLVELNLSNNRISDCTGLSVLLRLEYLNLSHNEISRVAGLEHMAGLRTLKLQHNRIGSIRGIRLLSYNSALQELCLEGNPVAEDAFFRSKVLSSLTLPCLKSIDGAPVKSRLSGQLKYSDMRVGIRPVQSSRRGSFDDSRCSSASSGVNQSAASFHCSDDGSIRLPDQLPPSAARPPSGEHSYSELLVDPLQFATQLVNSTSRGQQLSGQQQQLLPMMMTTRARDDDDDAGHSPPPCEHRPEEPSLVGDHLHLDDLQDYQHYLQLSTLPWRRPPSIRPNYCGGVFKYSKTIVSPNPSKGSGGARAPSPSPMKMGARINPPYSAQKTRRTNDAAAPVSSPSQQQQQQVTAANPNEWMAPILKEGWQGRKGPSSLDGLALPLPPTASPDHRQLASRSISHNAASMQRISASKVQRTVKGPTASASNSPTRSSLIRSSFISTVVRSKQEMENIEQALINDRRTTINDRRATINDRRATYISPQKQSSSNLRPAPRGGNGRSAIVDAYSQNKSTAQHLIDSQEYRHQDSASISQEYHQQGSWVSDEPPIGGELAESPYRRFLTLRERLTNKLITSSDQFPKQDEFSAGYSESKSGATLGIDLPLSTHEDAHHSTYGFARMLTPDDVDAIFSDDQLGSTGSTAAKREHVTELKKIESKVDSLSLQDRLLLVGNQLGSAAVAEDTHTHPNLTQTSNSEVNGYGLLYSMIQQRKTILDSISTNAPPRVVTSATTAPHPADDSAAASIAKDTGTAVSTRTIYDAIGKLKERQLASFQELYGAAPLVTDDPWSLGSRSAEAHTVQHLVQPVLPPHASSQSAGNSSFLDRFVENNPYIRLQQQGQAQGQQQQRPPYRTEHQAVVSDSRQLVWTSNGYHL